MDEENKDLVVSEPVGTPATVSDKADPAFDKDFEQVQTNLQELTNKGAVVFDEIRSLADQAQSIYGYEVLANYIKNLAEVNEKLVGIHLKKKKMKEDSSTQKPPAGGSRNNFFVGTTRDLQDFIVSQKAKDITNETE